jgi:hypothetical protein
MNDRLTSLLTPERFLAWLRGMGSKDTAGKRADSCHCPVARYLGRGGVTIPFVGVHEVEDLHVSSREVVPKPEWVERFTTFIDGGGAGSAVTAGECLAAMERVENGEAEADDFA